MKAELDYNSLFPLELLPRPKTSAFFSKHKQVIRPTELASLAFLSFFSPDKNGSPDLATAGDFTSSQRSSSGDCPLGIQSATVSAFRSFRRRAFAYPPPRTGTSRLGTERARASVTALTAPSWVASVLAISASARRHGDGDDAAGDLLLHGRVQRRFGARNVNYSPSEKACPLCLGQFMGNISNGCVHLSAYQR